MTSVLMVCVAVTERFGLMQHVLMRTACVCMLDGYTKIERLPLMPTMKRPVFPFRRELPEHSRYPQRILVDPLYRTLSWCEALGIQLTRPALGRPAKNAGRAKWAKKQAYQDICDRSNEAEQM